MFNTNFVTLFISVVLIFTSVLTLYRVNQLPEDPNELYHGYLECGAIIYGMTYYRSPVPGTTSTSDNFTQFNEQFYEIYRTSNVSLMAVIPFQCEPENNSDYLDKIQDNVTSLVVLSVILFLWCIYKTIDDYREEMLRK